MPRLPVRYVEISPITEPYRALMEAQIMIHFSGGIAEAIYRGERRRGEVLAFAIDHCNMDTDLERAAAVMDYDEQRVVDRTLTLLMDHWPAAKLLAWALGTNKRVEGRWVERLIAYSAMPG